MARRVLILPFLSPRTGITGTCRLSFFCVAGFGIWFYFVLDEGTGNPNSGPLLLPSPLISDWSHYVGLTLNVVPFVLHF